MAARSGRGPVGRALETALRAVQTEPADAAAVALARRMASEVDNGPTSPEKAGAVLIRILTELGMTPKARSAVVRGATSDDGTSERQRALDELRERRARSRPNDAAAVD